MYTLEELSLLTMEERWQCILPISRAIEQFPKLILTDDQIQALRQGKIIQEISQQAHGLVQLHSHHHIYVGLGELREDRTLVAKRLCAF